MTTTTDPLSGKIVPVGTGVRFLRAARLFYGQDGEVVGNRPDGRIVIYLRDGRTAVVERDDVEVTHQMIWSEQTHQLVADLDRVGARDEDEDGSPFSFRRVDGAIQSAVETWCEREGVIGERPDFGYDTPVWQWIIEDVLGYLGLAYDVIYEVAP